MRGDDLLGAPYSRAARARSRSGIEAVGTAADDGRGEAGAGGRGGLAAFERGAGATPTGAAPRFLPAIPATGRRALTTVITMRYLTGAPTPVALEDGR
jgi:hypothetical protein